MLKLLSQEIIHWFEFSGTDISILNFWTSIELRLKIAPDDFHLYVGHNVSSVQQMHDDHMSSWFYSVLPWKTRVVRVNAFQPSCVGVATREAYRISLQIKKVDYFYVLMTLGGIFLFYKAKDLCRNVFFHYTTGVGAGILLSLIVIIFFIQKKVRRKKFKEFHTKA